MSVSAHIEVTVIGEGQSMRLDAYLADQLKDKEQYSSRSAIAKAIEAGQVSIDSSVVTKPSKKVRSGDIISFKQQETASMKKIKPIDIPILYTADDYVIIEKPPGVLSDKKHENDSEPVIVDLIRSQGIEIMPSTPRRGLVHRLDRDTSGVMIVARNKEFHDHISAQFAARSVQKTYYAVCSGSYSGEVALHIKTHIERNPKKPYTFRASSTGKLTETIIDLTHEPPYYVIKAKPITGRTHQIRVHCAYIGLPVVGDIIYGGQVSDRLMLHAQNISFQDCSGTKVSYEAPLPAVFTELVKQVQDTR